MSATLTIAGLDETTTQKLHAQASSHGRSVEAEARAILVRAVSGEEVKPSLAAEFPDCQPFLDLAGSIDGTPDLSRKRGFEV